jgi:hypothetical protein
MKYSVISAGVSHLFCRPSTLAWLKNTIVRSFSGPGALALYWCSETKENYEKLVPKHIMDPKYFISSYFLIWARAAQLVCTLG